jgi:hypothetical protein
MTIKVRCKICKAESTINPDADTIDIFFPPETSPIAGKSPHPALRDCALMQPLTADQLILEPSVEVLES